MLKQSILYKTLFVVLFLVFFLSLDANAQRRGRAFRFQNILEHDMRPYHFGFTLGLNTMNFTLTPVEDLPAPFTYILQGQDYGFHVGIVSNLKLSEHFDLRFVPTFSFGSRYVEFYEGEFKDGYTYRQEELDPYFLDFPLHIKYKSARMTNTRAYVIGGLKFSHDLSSSENLEASGDVPLYLRTRQNDLHYEFGVGFDHYFYYFKFSTEIKASFGLRNLVFRGDDAHPTVNPSHWTSIDRLNSRSIMISFLFE